MSQPASWAVENPHSEYSAARRALVEAEYALWRTLHPLADVDSEQDWTVVCTQIQRDTTFTKGLVTRRFLSLDTLEKLPRLKALIGETWIIDLHMLGVIAKAAAGAPIALQDDPYFWRCLDEDLMERFTPSRPQQLLPSVRAVTSTVTNTIRSVEEAAAPDPDPWGKEEEPEEEGPVPCDDPAEFLRHLPPASEDDTSATLFTETLEDGRMNFSLTVDQVTGTLISDTLAQIASSKETSQAKAMVMQLVEPTNIKVNTLLYKASDVDGAPVYHPTTGVLTEKSAALLEEMTSRILDMDAAADAQTPAHDMTFRIRAFVLGRDWGCRWPGCTRPAQHLDGDHRINYEDGGPTRPDNLVMLCRHHHNRKTDQQATYLLDPVTGDVYWHFPDGTYAVDLAEGPLAPRQKNWVTTYAQRKERARQYAADRAAVEKFEEYEKANRPRPAPEPRPPREPIIGRKKPAGEDDDPPPF
ncbi:MAG: HNH endonuclease signature motif containing protein [Corynebacterium sp.]|uniref:HNH endonuclease signature motif containing protein n=1 Tax=Corynebacterium sp. TaxID=1720 RepID=UPI0026E05C51|nr:HNH endonuclease signature motif containing protein [Corynebacterium sp.]MDO5668837.1 HNH endonuclease signature motif containing protein [Corynebacterium sp.]